MELTTSCIRCHTNVDQTDFYCRVCGKNLRAKPPSMDPFTLAGLFIGSLLLPPFGIFWGLKYIREDNQQSKLVGLIACGLTILSIIFAVVGTMKIYTIVSNGVSNKLQEYQGL